MSEWYSEFVDSSVDDGVVEYAQPEITLYIDIDEKPTKQIQMSGDLIDIDEEEFDYYEDYDEDTGRGGIYVSLSSAKGDIDSLDYDSTEISTYASSRKLVISNIIDEEYEPTEFYKKHAGKELTPNLVDEFMNMVVSENVVYDAMISINLASTNVKFEKFSDTPYGDLSGQDYKGDIDISGFGLTSLKGSPKSVSKHFDASNNKLKDLEYAPESVGTISLHHNELENLNGLPKITIPHSKANKVSLSGGIELKDKFELEFKYRKKHPEMKTEDLYFLIYDETGNAMFLDKEVVDTFMF